MPEEQGGGKRRVAVLSHRLWQQRYGGSVDVIGQTIQISGHSLVVGILPSAFKLIFPEVASVPCDVDIYVPFEEDLAKQPRDQAYIRILGRLREGVSMQQAQAELDNIAAQLRSEFLEYSGQNLRLQASPLREVASTFARERGPADKEIGVRLALGGQEIQIAAMILRSKYARRAFRIQCWPLLSSLLVGVRPIEPVLLVSVFLFIALVGLFASCMPVRRVLRKNPLSSLHYD